MRTPRSRWPRSLRERLALTSVLVTVVFLAAIIGLFNLVLAQQLRAGADDLLATRAQAVAASVRVLPGGALTLTDALPDRTADAGTWVYEGSVALRRPAGDREEQRRADSLAGVGERTLDTREPEAVRFHALPIRSGGRQVGTVVTSVALDPYVRVRDIAVLASAALAAVALAGSYLLTRSFLGRALTPVRQMTEQAARWSASDLERRFRPGRRPTELEGLAVTLDALLDRLSAVLRHEQQLSAELSHELRTPLSAVVAEVDLLDSRPRTAQELTAGHAAILAAAERMSRVLESLLTAARVTADTAPGRCEVLPAVRAALASVDPPPGVVQVDEQVPLLSAGVEGALLERALAPVLDNALRHRREAVHVTIDTGPGGPCVSVQDDGPGVPDALADTVFEPGVRGVDGHGGAGLGLALARRLARAGGGDLDLVPSVSGACFVLSLPTA